MIFSKANFKDFVDSERQKYQLVLVYTVPALEFYSRGSI